VWRLLERPPAITRGPTRPGRPTEHAHATEAMDHLQRLLEQRKKARRRTIVMLAALFLFLPGLFAFIGAREMMEAGADWLPKLVVLSMMLGLAGGFPLAELRRAGFGLELRTGGVALVAGTELLSRLGNEPDRIAALAPIAHWLARLAHHLRASAPDVSRAR
jgi:peptidoglycan/LPS O-acetylase OafA/YrhL